MIYVNVLYPLECTIFSMKNGVQRAQYQKPKPNWEHLPNWEVVIQTDPTPSIHSRLLGHLENSRLYVDILYLLQYNFVSMKI